MTTSRRQQSDRTAATRASVLDATVELLIERGYAGTSTRLAAERAGVSLGALQHHFRTKAELSVEAMRYVTERLAGELVERDGRHIFRHELREFFGPCAAIESIASERGGGENRIASLNGALLHRVEVA